MAEKNGLVDRDKLYDISGRSRKIQMDLAQKFNIPYIPQPGGGCILTETDYGQRLKKLISIKPDFDGSDAQVLRHCRPVWEKNLFFAIARNQADCIALKSLAKPSDTIFEPQNFPGPIVLVRNFGGLIGQEEIEILGKRYLLQYSKKIPAASEISMAMIEK